MQLCSFISDRTSSSSACVSCSARADYAEMYLQLNNRKMLYSFWRSLYVGSWLTAYFSPSQSCFQRRTKKGFWLPLVAVVLNAIHPPLHTHTHVTHSPRATPVLGSRASLSFWQHTAALLINHEGSWVRLIKQRVSSHSHKEQAFGWLSLFLSISQLPSLLQPCARLYWLLKC